MPSRNATLAGIGMMLLGILMFSLNDVMGKWLVATYTVGQVLLMRSVAGLAVPALLALLGSVLFAGMMIAGRQLRGTPDVTLVAWQTLGALLMGLVLLPLGWVTPNWADAGLLGLLGIVAMAAHLCVTRSLKLAEASVVVPYQYTLIVWALVFGWLVFGDWPTPAMLAGSVLIVAAGLALLLLERRAAPAKAALDLP